MVATISADIVSSTSLKTEDLMKLRNELNGLFEDLAELYPGFWARVVKGDSIECYVPDYKYALKIALIIKLWIKMIVDKFSCSRQLKKYGIRFSIAIADIKYANKDEDIIDGQAIYMSGRNLDALNRKEGVYSSFSYEKESQSLNNLLCSYVVLLSEMIDSCSAKQAEVIYNKMRGYKEKEISNNLNISQSSVNARAKFAKWNILSTAITSFEDYVNE